MPEHTPGLQIRWVEAEAMPVPLQPGDVLVLMLPDTLSVAASATLEAHLERLFPQHRVLILDAGMRLGVLRREGEGAAP